MLLFACLLVDEGNSISTPFCPFFFGCALRWDGVSMSPKGQLWNFWWRGGEIWYWVLTWYLFLWFLSSFFFDRRRHLRILWGCDTVGTHSLCVCTCCRITGVTFILWILTERWSAGLLSHTYLPYLRRKSRPAYRSTCRRPQQVDVFFAFAACQK